MAGFIGCYLLQSKNTQAKGRTYIGFTVNPQRRIRQHNGEITNGAFKTKKWRPWDMVLVVYGFATQTAALQFEWAWQHPDKSLDARDAAAKVGRKARYGVRGKVLMLMEMLNTSPWKHYPLKIKFLKGEHAQLRAGCPEPPSHVQMSVGPLEDLEFLAGDDDDQDNESSVSGITMSQVTGTAAPSQSQSQSQATATTKRRRGVSACCICTKAASRTWTVCSSCPARSHVGCLAEHFLSCGATALNASSSSLPARGSCPACGAAATWTEVLATMQHAGWAKHKKKAAGDEPTITEVDEEVEVELPSVPSSPKRPKKKISRGVQETGEGKLKAAPAPSVPVAAPSSLPAPAPWMDDEPPNWNCRDAIAAALEKTAAGTRYTRRQSSSSSLRGGSADGDSSGPDIAIEEAAAPWDDYFPSNESNGDENVIDLVSPSPLKDNKTSGGGGGAAGNDDENKNTSNTSKEMEVIELLTSDDE